VGRRSARIRCVRYHIIAVGRAGQGPERALFERFAARLSPPPVLREVQEKRSLTPVELMEREGRLLLDAVPKGAAVVAMDEKGKTLSSNALAVKIGEWRDRGVHDLAFLIGGANGLDDKVLGRVDLALSLGPMTWPHMLARGLLAEQLYRAQCILSGHPYHRE